MVKRTKCFKLASFGSWIETNSASSWLTLPAKRHAWWTRGLRTLNTIWKCWFVETHCDEAVRLDLVDPEALFHHAARPVQQLFELAQSEGSHLWDTQPASIKVDCHFQSGSREKIIWSSYLNMSWWIWSVDNLPVRVKIREKQVHEVWREKCSTSKGVALLEGEWCQSVQHVGLEWIILTTSEWIAMKFCIHVHIPQRMNPDDLGGPPLFV